MNSIGKLLEKFENESMRYETNLIVEDLKSVDAFVYRILADDSWEMVSLIL